MTVVRATHPATGEVRLFQGGWPHARRVLGDNPTAWMLEEDHVTHRFGWGIPVEFIPDGEGRQLGHPEYDYSYNKPTRKIGRRTHG
ncbi:hypothetical protein ABZ215_38580 [Amycolatopsis sp. NPDC006131]|uniref:hypothetical protein n=1 Tax=Amycolatopsis sp. NPDC006131 TaxID=3156731 RepID=UPI0033B36DA1